MSPLKRWAGAVDAWFLAPADGRIYALVRISFALLCLAELIETWPMRAALFSAEGMSWHRPDLLPYLPLKYVQSASAVTTLMVLVGVAALALAVGLLTRLSAFVVYLWFFAASAIGYPAESGYDGIVRIVGLVQLVSPSVRTWAMDARLFGAQHDEPPRYALRLLQVQLAIIYVCTVWVKAPDSYWRNGELMGYFMMSMYSRFPSAAWATLGRTSVLMTWGTLLAETFIPICLFSARLRRLGFALGIALHGGIAMASTVGMFSLAMLPLYAAFLTSEDVDALSSLIRRKK